MTKYDPPSAVKREAKRGLEARAKYDRGGLSPAEAKAQGIDSGVIRAKNLIAGNITVDQLKKMRNFFNRHEKNFRPSKKMPDGGPTAGTIATWLWGGMPGKQWANDTLAKLQETFTLPSQAGRIAVENGTDLPYLTFAVNDKFCPNLISRFLESNSASITRYFQSIGVPIDGVLVASYTEPFLATACTDVAIAVCPPAQKMTEQQSVDVWWGEDIRLPFNDSVLEQISYHFTASELQTTHSRTTRKDANMVERKTDQLGEIFQVFPVAFVEADANSVTADASIGIYEASPISSFLSRPREEAEIELIDSGVRLSSAIAIRNENTAPAKETCYTVTVTPESTSKGRSRQVLTGISEQYGVLLLDRDMLEASHNHLYIPSNRSESTGRKWANEMLQQSVAEACAKLIETNRSTMSTVRMKAVKNYKKEFGVKVGKVLNAMHDYADSHDSYDNYVAMALLLELSNGDRQQVYRALKTTGLRKRLSIGVMGKIKEMVEAVDTDELHPAVKSFADDLGVPYDEAQRRWHKARNLADKRFPQPKKRADGHFSKTPASKHWRYAMAIFKTMMYQDPSQNKSKGAKAVRARASENPAPIKPPKAVKRGTAREEQLIAAGHKFLLVEKRDRN